jgi:phosphoribosylglycinamide formyltransferase-1
VEIKLVISSNPKAVGLRFARQAHIPWKVIERKSCGSDQEFSERVFSACRQAKVDLVVMAGFIKYLPIPTDFENRVLNIHPALIPAFCGKGLYGHHVHQAVLRSGVRVTGCTVHLVDNQYDHGPIILQKTVPVLEGDTPETLAARVFEAEREAYPEAIQRVVLQRTRRGG